MELDQMKQLDTIQSTGSMAAAAKALHISQSTLSRSMQRLEAELNCELFDRTRNSAILNSDGDTAVHFAREMLAIEQRIRDTFIEIAASARTLRVGTVAPAPLWRLTALTVERFPGTILRSEALTETEVEQGVLNGTLDFGICLRPIALPNLYVIPILTENILIDAPTTHPIAQESSTSFSDVAHDTFLVFAQIGFWRNVLDEHLPEADIIYQEDREVLDQLRRSTNALSFTTDAVSNFGSSTGRVAIPIRDTAAHATFYLTALKDSSDRVREICEWVRETA